MYKISPKIIEYVKDLEKLNSTLLKYSHLSRIG